MHKQFAIKSEEEQIVIGEVYVPDSVDTQGDAMKAEEIKKMAYDFMINGRTLKIDIEHDRTESGCAVVESFIARDGDPDYKPGSWVMATKIFDPNLWQMAKSGYINGYSFFSDELSFDTSNEVILQATKLAGDTDPSDGGPNPGHSHRCEIEFDDSAKVIPTWTAEGPDGHRHKVSKITATEVEMGHAHRLRY